MGAELISIVALPFIGAVIWLVRLEGRVNTAERLNDERFETLKEGVDRIEGKLDRVLGIRWSDRGTKT